MNGGFFQNHVERSDRLGFNDKKWGETLRKSFPFFTVFLECASTTTQYLS